MLALSQRCLPTAGCTTAPTAIGSRGVPPPPARSPSRRNQPMLCVRARARVRVRVRARVRVRVRVWQP